MHVNMSDVNFLNKHVNQFQIYRDKYEFPNILPSDVSTEIEPDEQRESFPGLQNDPDFSMPKLCIWAFMKEDEIYKLMNVDSLDLARKMIDMKVSPNASYPKASPRMVLTELLYTVLKFSKANGFNIRQTASLLSITYLTHRYFTSSYLITAEDIFTYFKDMLVYHSLEYIPDYLRIFNPHDAHRVFVYFCKLYLRHLPIIRLLSLPNFGFHLNFEVDDLPSFKSSISKPGKKGKDKDKGKKDKKAKAEKASKGTDKGSSKGTKGRRSPK